MFISFAQNFEDVLLWRALKHIEKGFYIDIGAQHPEADSVSKAFYDHDWRGVHVEPIRHYADLLREHRPDEVVLEVAIAQESGILTFYDVPDTGLSTADSGIAEGHQQQGFEVRETTVPCIPLSDVLARYGDRDIHWLKIDVEGFELAVLNGWGDSPIRPWVVVVESNLPNTQIDTHEIWEAQLLERGYTSVLFDGLNRYYVSEHHPELKESLQYGPSVFDQFAFSPTVPHAFTALIWQAFDQERDRAQQELSQERDRAQQAFDQERDRAQQAFDRERDRAQHLEAAWNESKGQVEALHTQLDQQTQALQQQLTQEEARAQTLIRQLESQKQNATSQIEALRIQLAQREQAFVRERDRAQTLQSKLSVIQSKLSTIREKNGALNKRANQARREANQFSQELTSVYSSLSWKFGAPLRISKRAAKKVLRIVGVIPTPVAPAPAVLNKPKANLNKPKAKVRNGKLKGKTGKLGQHLKPAVSAAMPEDKAADTSGLRAELNQVSSTTQQVHQRLMQARRPGHQDPD